jgi:hypothetical protein
MLSVHPPYWCITEGSSGAVVQKPRRSNDPYVLQASQRSQSIFTLKSSQKPDKCASLSAVFKKGSTGRIGWGLSSDYEVSADITLSEKDQSVRMQCTYQIGTSNYLYSVQLEDSKPETFQSHYLIPNFEPFIELSGLVVVSDLLYLIGDNCTYHISNESYTSSVHKRKKVRVVPKHRT